MAETDAEEWHLVPNEAGDDIEAAIQVRGVARSGRDDDTVRPVGSDVGIGRAERNDGHPNAPSLQGSNDVPFDTAVDDNDMRAVSVELNSLARLNLADGVTLFRQDR